MKPETYRIDRHGNVLQIILESEDGRNLLSVKAVTELHEAISKVNADQDIDAVIITASGRIFSMGADIFEISSISPWKGYSISRFGQETLKMITRGPKFTIAAVNGFAMGAGCELAMACNIRIASTKAKFSLPEIKLGVIPGYGGTQYLPRLVGKSRALELILSGKLIPASEALRTGLIHEICAPDELEQRALSRARSYLEETALPDCCR